MRKVLILFLFVMVVSCTSSQDEKLLAESAEIHDSALEISKRFNEKVELIRNHADGSQEPIKSVLGDSVRLLLEEYAAWESTIVEVPGHDHDHEHDHDHSHDHDHDHTPDPDLTPQMMLDIQKEIKAKIEKLDERAQNTLSTIE